MDEDYRKVYEYIKDKYPKIAEDIYFGLDYFLCSVDDALAAFRKDMSSVNTPFSTINQIAIYGQILQSIKEQANEYLDFFDTSESENENISTAEEEQDEKVLPNYNDFAVDSEIPHTLNESFTYKKICGFMLNGIKYSVLNWQNALVTLCEILYDINPIILQNLINSPNFKGSKNTYFVNKSNGSKYYVKLSDANIYVWTNLSTQMICRLIARLLRSYSFSINSIYIFLRADYSPLHTTNTILSNNEFTANFLDSEEEKVGKYVRQKMRDLAERKYIFSSEMLLKLTNSSESKLIFGKGIGFFREYNDKIDFSSQLKDTNGRNRYWKEVFSFNGKKFLIISQWYEQSNDRDRFDNWYNSL